MTRKQRIVVPVILLCAFPGAVAAAPRSAPQTPPTYQVVRLGDGQLTCEALVAEIGGVTAELDRIQRDMMDRSMDLSQEATAGLGGGGMGGAAMSLGSMAASFIPGADMLMGAAASAAAAAQLERQRSRMVSEAEAMAGEALIIGPMSQRLEHLAELSRDKNC